MDKALLFLTAVLLLTGCAVTAHEPIEASLDDSTELKESTTHTDLVVREPLPLFLEADETARSHWGSESEQLLEKFSDLVRRTVRIEIRSEHEDTNGSVRSHWFEGPRLIADVRWAFSGKLSISGYWGLNIIYPTVYFHIDDGTSVSLGHCSHCWIVEFMDSSWVWIAVTPEMSKVLDPCLDEFYATERLSRR